jgi:hypothetical protein
MDWIAVQQRIGIKFIVHIWRLTRILERVARERCSVAALRVRNQNDTMVIDILEM